MGVEIDGYLAAFANLRTDHNRNRWSAATCYRAPHKPFLLLSILDQIAQGGITGNFIEPSFELAETFVQYWSRVMPLGSSGNVAYPYFYMDSEPFWELVLRPGAEAPVGRTVSSMKRIRELYLGAKLDEELFLLLQMPSLRERLRAVLIEKYFAPEVRPLLLEQGEINLQAYEYGKSLLAASKSEEITLEFKNESLGRQVRDQGFRKAIVKLYEHRCALCGIRMLTPDGHTVVEAAHIVPWSESKNDKPTNGLALCRLCHWSFDEGLMAVGKSYEVKISPQVKREPNFPGHMLTLSDRPIFRPQDSTYWPMLENFAWHRKAVFRK
ncbi:MAG: HNH endonuclease [Proteobacteria bacterium]|nr:HNH endonuclease [Pseudomonadota bacterium]MBU1638875.1 HNH endonuclease [Pseudomonadota bacterium]